MTPPEKKTEKRTEKKTERRGLDRIRPEASRDRQSRDRRLDTPQETHPPLVRRPRGRPHPVGGFAEQFARFMGTATFLIYMTLFVFIWVGWNFIVPKDMRFDDYPFIFLTLILSL